MSNAERMKDISNSEHIKNGFSPKFPAFFNRHPELQSEIAERQSKFEQSKFCQRRRQQIYFQTGEWRLNMSNPQEEIPLTNSTSQNHSFPGASMPLKGSGKFNDPERKEKHEKFMEKYQYKFQHHPSGDYTEAASKVPAKMRSLDKERKEILDKTMKEPTEKVGAFKEAYRAMTHKKNRW